MGEVRLEHAPQQRRATLVGEGGSDEDIPMQSLTSLLIPLLLLSACGAAPSTPPAGDAVAVADTSNLATAVFGGGCFWCMEPPFDAVDGVVATTSGYMGGTVANPTYEQVVQGNTGHLEVVRVTYDSTAVSYGELLDVFWTNIDPVQSDGQFYDLGSQYVSAIFVQSDVERARAEASRERLKESGRLGRKQIATEIRSATEFYVAEEYHQDFYLKYPARYRAYRTSCARDARLRELWDR